jgi:hypothetical protein
MERGRSAARDDYVRRRTLSRRIPCGLDSRVTLPFRGRGRRHSRGREGHATEEGGERQGGQQAARRSFEDAHESALELLHGSSVTLGGPTL